MAIGGYGSLLDSEIITIGGGTRVCPKPANLTENTYFGTGGYVTGRPLVCGASDTYECRYYSFEQGQWQQEVSLSTIRNGATSLPLADGTLWITGGRAGVVDQESTEIYRDGAFAPGPDLFLPRTSHCLVRLNDTHSFLAGGLKDRTNPSPFARIFNWQTRQWTSAGSLRIGRENHACALIDNPPRVIVIGGRGEDGHTDTIEVLDLETMTWGMGPKTPGGSWIE